MKKTRFTEVQIIAVLRQMEDGLTIAKLCREHGMSSATLYKWRARYAAMDTTLFSEMKAMAEENLRLNRMYVDVSMKSNLPKEALGKMYDPPRYCKFFVGDASACVSVSSL